MGVWLWTRNPRGLSHAGNIVYQAACKSTVNVVKLKVEYYSEDVFKFGGRPVTVLHSGTIGNLNYHDSDPAVIVQNEIPLSSIQVIGRYNIVDLLNRK